MAKRFEVLLKEDVADLGNVGDVVRVASGYARNFLLPYGKAIRATEDNKRQIARRAARAAQARELKAEEVAKAIEALNALEVSTSERADEKGNLYGSVSGGQVAQLITQAGILTDEKQVRLETPIKHTGEHKVRVHVFGNQDAEVTVRVDAQE